MYCSFHCLAKTMSFLKCALMMMDILLKQFIFHALRVKDSMCSWDLNILKFLWLSLYLLSFLIYIYFFYLGILTVLMATVLNVCKSVFCYTALNILSNLGYTINSFCTMYWCFLLLYIRQFVSFFSIMTK